MRSRSTSVTSSKLFASSRIITNELFSLSFAVVKTDQSTWLDGFVTDVGALVAGPHGSSTKMQSHSLLKRELFRVGRVI